MGVKSRCAMQWGRSKRRIWFDTVDAIGPQLAERAGTGARERHHLGEAHHAAEVAREAHHLVGPRRVLRGLIGMVVGREDDRLEAQREGALRQPVGDAGHAAPEGRELVGEEEDPGQVTSRRPPRPRVSGIRPATSTPESKVRAATTPIAQAIPKRSESAPARSAPTA